MFRLTVFFAVLVGMAMDCPTFGVQLYSVNSVTDELVRIDTETGSITTVGAIGHEMRGTDLTYLNGLLYGVTQKSPGFNLDGMTLVAIDPITGAKVSSVDVRLDGSEVFAEGLTTANGELIVSFDHLSLTSVRTGVVNPVTGEITDPQHHGPDLDEMGTDLTGQIIAVDGRNYSGNTRQMAFYAIDRTPPEASFIGDFLVNGSLDDIVFTPFGTFSLDHLGQGLFQVDLSNSPAVAGLLPLGSAGAELDGLAYVPEPSTIILLLTGALGLLAYRIRRR